MSDQQSNKGLPVGSLNLEVASLKQKLDNKEQDLSELISKYQSSLSERERMEDELLAMKEKVKDADSKLNEVKAETEAAIRQNESNEQELAIIRRRSLVGGGGQIITQMYETILSRYEELKTVHDELQRKMNEESERKAKLEKQLSTLRLHDHDAEKEALTHQNQALREHVEVLKREVGRQAKDLNRIREERTSFKREYSLVMSERDAVHKEMDKLQEDLSLKQQENESIEVDHHRLLKENEKLKNQIANLQQGTVASLDFTTLQEELYAALQERKQALNEKEAKVHEAYTAQKAHKQALERIESLSIERDRLNAEVDLSRQQLEDAMKEVKDTTRWRELAFSERDKLNRELDESRKVCDKLTEERENLFKQLEEAVKELDSMKEAKKKLQIKLHEFQTRTDMRNLESTENAHSHDSAIDSGDWESEPNVAYHKLSHVKRILPGQHDITIEPGFFVKHSNTPGVGVGDRVLALGEVPVHNKSVREVNELLSRKSTLLLHLVKCVPLRKTSTSLVSSHDDINKNIPNGFSTSPQKIQPGENNVWTTDNAQVILRRAKPTQPYTESPRNIKSGIFESPGKMADKRESTIYHCEQDSEVSGRTVFSEPSYGIAKAEGVKPTNETLTSSYTTSGKKKKPKISTFFRKKKSKSVAGPSDLGESPSGTWPRLDSPSIVNVLTGGGGGRFSVLARKKNRPSISPNTFTPPDGPSAGHTPPTPLRNQLTLSPNSTLTSPPQSPPVGVAEVTPLSSREPVSSVTTRLRHHHHQGKAAKKKTRPLSAPIETRGLSMWQQPVQIDAELPSPEISTAKKNFVQVSPVPSSATPSPSHPQRSSVNPYERSLISPNPTPSPALTNRSSYVYQRQQSVPESGKLSLALPTSCFSSSMTTPSVPTSTSGPRNAHSLPRPTSAREPTFSVPHSHESRKAKTMDYKRIRIPSEVSVGRMISGSEKGSITLSSDRSSSYLFTTVDPPTMNSNSARSTPHPDSISSLSVGSSTPSTRSRKPPVTNDPRYITMVRGLEPIGISIVSGETGGIFVSRLTDNSLASKAGLEYGDQLLEFNGVNLRNAKETQARVIMSQTQPGDNIKFLVQYNLEKYKQSIESNLSDTLGISRPPPQNGPVVSEEVEEGTITPEVTPRASPQVEETLRAQRLNEPRYVFMSGGCTNVKLVGGNERGIYVTSLVSNEETLTDKLTELKIGDRIIEFNSVSFANITLESASKMLSQCTTGASFCVIYEPNRYKQIYGLPGDHFYVRTLFDHMVEQEGALQFTRNSIVLVENTYPDYVTGQWVASLVDEQGGRSTRGRIPSKITWEKERENSSHLSDDVTSTTGSASGKRLSGSGRRSFFKRLKPHRNSSRSSGDVRLHRSPSENSLESAADVASESLGAYQVVEKHSSATSRRPVVVFGPHATQVVEKLTRDYAQQFVKCCLGSTIEMPQQSDIIATYNYVTGVRVLTGDILRQTMKQFPNRHVLLESSVEAIDRLHSIKVYPIIAFIKYSSAKKIKESQERVAGREKSTIKQCKELLEKQSAIEQTLLSKYYGTVIINGGLASQVAVKISKVVSHEHSKVLWLPSPSNLLNY